jgi:hypothetical protein
LLRGTYLPLSTHRQFQDPSMHQSPQKQIPTRRDKFADFDEAQADHRPYRGAHPKARKFSLRDESRRELRRERQHPGK